MRENIKPTVTEGAGIFEDGTRHDHPAFGIATVTRGHYGGPSPRLFGSDTRPISGVTLTIHHAHRERDLMRDTETSDAPVVQVTMTEGQWGALVTSAGIGSGVPVTLEYTEQDGHLPGIDEEPRLSESFKEVRESVREMLAEARKTLDDLEDVVESKKGIRATREALRRHRANLDNADANAEFSVRSAADAAEKVRDRLRADIESQIASSARAAGLSGSEPGLALPEIDS